MSAKPIAQIQPKPVEAPDSILVLQNVSKAFAGKYAVHDVSLNVRRGEIFGFLGPNGAGKSTTIRMILDVLRPTEGEISLFGVSSREATKVHRHIGYLSGDMVLDSNLTGQQYLDFAASQYGKDCREQIKTLKQLLQADLSLKIGNYSRGNRQKIGLIAALMHQPQLLILDEPTSGFDPLVQENFVKLIRRFRDSGRTVFMSSHILNEVQELCDRVAFIKDGQIIDTTTVSKLTDSAAKRVTVKLPANQSNQTNQLRTQLKALAGVRMGQTVETYGAQFSYDGTPKPLLRLLSNYEISDVTIKEPDLEEIFMHYYEKKPETKDIEKATLQ